MVEASSPRNEGSDEETKGGEDRGSMMVTDAKLYENEGKAGDILTDEVGLQFSVSNPHDYSGHIVYDVKGVDSQGVFECKRRYNEFDALHEQLTKRWPGILIPQIPKKKAIGNKDRVYLMERRFYLERFIRNLAKFDFIVESPEFQIWARPQGGDVSSGLKKMPKLTPEQLYERVKTATNCDDAAYDERQKEQFDRAITEFAFFEKKAEKFLKQLKNDITMFLNKKQQVMKSYSGMTKILTDYEDHNLTQYSDVDVSKLVLNNPNNAVLKSGLATIEAQMNPFTILYHWIKGEVYDLGSFSAIIANRNAVAKRVKELKKAKASTQKDIEAVNAGKKTVTTLFKKPEDVGNMSAKVERYDAETEVQIKLLDVMTIYIGNHLLEEFKREKLQLYKRIISQYYVIEMGNAHAQASFWNEMLQESSVKSAGQSQGTI